MKGPLIQPRLFFYFFLNKFFSIQSELLIQNAVARLCVCVFVCRGGKDVGQHVAMLKARMAEVGVGGGMGKVTRRGGEKGGWVWSGYVK